MVASGGSSYIMTAVFEIKWEGMLFAEHLEKSGAAILEERSWFAIASENGEWDNQQKEKDFRGIPDMQLMLVITV